MVLSGLEDFPYFLQSYENLSEHLRGLFDEQQLTPKEKGDKFADFVTKIIPLTEIGIRVQFETIERRKHSYDEGIDIVCRNASGTQILYVQCKLTLNRVEDLDSVFSKYQNYSKKHHPAPDLGLWKDEVDKRKYPDIFFMIVTLSKLENIIRTYRREQYPSKSFYQDLKESGQLEIYDGVRLFPLLQSCYRRIHILPTNVVIRLGTPPIQKGGVYIGIISATELKKCYDQFGDALFLENIRSFLGATSGKKKVNDKRENVNEAILATAQEAPDQMLARNNGITFRARTVKQLDENVLQLDEGSIVNGCQTTMCLIQAPNPESFILVKIVEASEAWEIAKTANFQNKVEQIQLLLAEYIRLPLAQGIGMKGDVHIRSQYTSVLDVFSTFYRHEVAYEEIDDLFLGFFSRNIRNIIDANYTEIRDDLLKTIQGPEATRSDVFYAIFELYEVSRQAAKIVEEIQRDDDEPSDNDSDGNLFQRFWNDNKPYYRSFLAILTACAFVNTNIYAERIKADEFRDFLSRLQTTLKSDKERFIRCYQYTFDVVAAQVVNTEKEEREVKQRMSEWLKRVNFDTLYKLVRQTVNSREKQRQRDV